MSDTININVHLTIGYRGATHDDTLQVDKSELQGLSDNEIADRLNEITQEWANEYIEYFWEMSKQDKEKIRKAVSDGVKT